MAKVFRKWFAMLCGVGVVLSVCVLWYKVGQAFVLELARDVVCCGYGVSQRCQQSYTSQNFVQIMTNIRRKSVPNR